MLTVSQRVAREFFSVWVFFRSVNSYFELEWHDGRVCIRASNGKYVIAKKNGQLAATVDNAGQSCYQHFSDTMRSSGARREN